MCIRDRYKTGVEITEYILIPIPVVTAISTEIGSFQCLLWIRQKRVKQEAWYHTCLQTLPSLPLFGMELQKYSDNFRFKKYLANGIYYNYNCEKNTVKFCRLKYLIHLHLALSGLLPELVEFIYQSIDSKELGQRHRVRKSLSECRYIS